MLIKHLVACLIFNISLNVCSLISNEILTAENYQKLLKSATHFLVEDTPNDNFTLSEMPPNCLQMLCKFVCFNGKSTEIERDILTAAEQNNHYCPTIEELRLYNYEFPRNKLSFGFLGIYSDKVRSLYLASANITDIEAGAFDKGIFKEIYFENLQLKELKKDYFQGISHEFSTLSIIQNQMPLQAVHSDFLCYVRYQIKYLTLQAGLRSIGNLTVGDILLSNLVYADFSRNDFGNKMRSTDFSKVSMIEHLDLSHSNLEYLSFYLFADLTMTLNYLNLSYNKLKTISRTIFGWRAMPRDLIVYAEGNPWSCSCALQHEMKLIFIYNRTSLFCAEPDYYKGWLVFDETLCAENNEATLEAAAGNETENSNMFTTLVNDDYNQFYEKTTKSILTTPAKHYSGTDPNLNHLLPQGLMKLHCSARSVNISERFTHLIQWPFIVFNVTSQNNLRVNIRVDSLERPYDSLGLLWFSKVTTKYYKMEINYNEYGLGCYNAISNVTTINDLLPNTAYTLCIVFKQQWTVSPFNCKSIYVSGNVSVKNNAWLTLDKKMTGLSLVIFGIIMFIFVGILMLYLILKHKPNLLKGSKRVQNTLSNNGDTEVLSNKETIRDIKGNEEKLTRHGPFSSSQQRRKSTDTEASYQSYINTNLYEVIAPFKMSNASREASSVTPKPTVATIFGDVKQNSENGYLTPLDAMPSSADLAHYAEIPYCAKRSDVLLKVPAEKPPVLQNKADYVHTGTIYVLDSQV